MTYLAVDRIFALMKYTFLHKYHDFIPTHHLLEVLPFCLSCPMLILFKTSKEEIIFIFPSWFHFFQHLAQGFVRYRVLFI